jgi:hypothetical protein
LQTSLQSNGDLSLEISKILLEQLIAGEGSSKLLSLKRIILSLVKAKLCSTKCTPSNSVSSIIQATNWTLQHPSVCGFYGFAISTVTFNPLTLGSKLDSGISTSSIIIIPVQVTRWLTLT